MNVPRHTGTQRSIRETLLLAKLSHIVTFQVYKSITMYTSHNIWDIVHHDTLPSVYIYVYTVYVIIILYILLFLAAFLFKINSSRLRPGWSESANGKYSCCQSSVDTVACSVHYGAVTLQKGTKVRYKGISVCVYI